MSIGDKIQTITENLTNVYGAAYVRGRDRGHYVGYESGYNVGFNEGNINGYTAGKAHGKQECEAVHYALSFLGNGTQSISLEIPFHPDVLTIYSTHPCSGAIGESFKSIVLDSRACGQHMGYILYSNVGGGLTVTTFSPVWSSEEIIYQDGVYTITIPETFGRNIFWRPYIRYTAIAAKYPEENAAELLREQIQLLPDEIPEGSSGTLKYFTSMVQRHMSAEEWDTLIAIKPNWSFVMA